MSTESPLTLNSNPNLIRQVTTKDVAALAGVDRSLVSVVLNGAKSTVTVSDAARERILKAADNLGYRRNGMAAGVRTGTFGSVALLLSSHHWASTLPLAVLDGINQELERRGTHLIVQRLPVATLSDSSRLPKVLTEWSCDGLLIDVTHTIPPHMAKAIEKAKLPAVWFNIPSEFDTVRPDDYQAGREAARRILELDHKRICYLDLNHTWEEASKRDAGSEDHYSGHDRYRGVRDELEEAGVEITYCFRTEEVPKYACDEKFASCYKKIEKILVEVKPTAIISYDDVGYSTLLVARDLKIRVPRDLSLIGFGTAPKWFLEHRLTLMAAPEREMGEQLPQLLFQKIENPAIKLPTITIPFGFEVGSTIGPAPDR